MRHAIRDAKGRFCKAAAEAPKKANKTNKHNKSLKLEEHVYDVGYRAFTYDLNYMGKAFFVGGTYEYNDDIKTESGLMHYYATVEDCLKNTTVALDHKSIVICKVEALAEAHVDGELRSTSRMRVVKIIELKDWIKYIYVTKDSDKSYKAGVHILKKRVTIQAGAASTAVADKASSTIVQTGPGSVAILREECSSCLQKGSNSHQYFTGTNVESLQRGNKSTQIAKGPLSYLTTQGNNCVSMTLGGLSEIISEGSNNVLIALGYGSKCYGHIGDTIILAERSEDTKSIINIVSAKVDGKVVKANTWYTVKNGKLVEVK